ncbi:TIGR02996 domain-containing protein [bacterium]|nr:TIGR02996 domain-containing protein [bacterium]
MSDDEFLRAVLADPTQDTPLLVYADWLDERGDPVSAAKAEFLRGTVGLRTVPKARHKGFRKRLQALAAGLDTDWLGVVSRVAVENCGNPANENRIGMRVFQFDVLCDRRWEDLRPTEDRGVRFCEGCGENVHYCDTIVEGRRHAHQGHCVAIDLGVIRRDGDLEPERMWVGRASAETLLQERERAQPDPVSAERERRKQQARDAGDGG